MGRDEDCENIEDRCYCIVFVWFANIEMQLEIDDTSVFYKRLAIKAVLEC